MPYNKNMMTRTVAITGNTYPVKDQIKALGARWNADKKAWMVPLGKADQARKIVAGASSTGRSSQSSGSRRCHDCGAPSKSYYRCYQCSLEYRDGGGMYNNGQSYYDSHGRFVLGDED